VQTVRLPAKMARSIRRKGGRAELTGSELLVAARREDQRAFEELVSEHRRGLYAHCYRMLGSVQDAEDALQESLLSAW
jgi:RNA polymerase sigma-70 factor (ECF subfamily)